MQIIFHARDTSIATRLLTNCIINHYIRIDNIWWRRFHRCPFTNTIVMPVMAGLNYNRKCRTPRPRNVPNAAEKWQEWFPAPPLSSNSENIPNGKEDVLPMPVYEYQCNACEDRFELRRKFSDDPVNVCPKCGGEVTKLISSAGGKWSSMIVL